MSNSSKPLSAAASSIRLLLMSSVAVAPVAADAIFLVQIVDPRPQEKMHCSIRRVRHAHGEPRFWLERQRGHITAAVVGANPGPDLMIQLSVLLHSFHVQKNAR